MVCFDREKQQFFLCLTFLNVVGLKPWDPNKTGLSRNWYFS